MNRGEQILFGATDFQQVSTIVVLRTLGGVVAGEALFFVCGGEFFLWVGMASSWAMAGFTLNIFQDFAGAIQFLKAGGVTGQTADI